MPAAKGKKKVAPEAAAAVPGRSVAPDADRRCARRAGEQPARPLTCRAGVDHESQTGS